MRSWGDGSGAEAGESRRSRSGWSESGGPSSSSGALELGSVDWNARRSADMERAAWTELAGLRGGQRTKPPRVGHTTTYIERVDDLSVVIRGVFGGPALAEDKRAAKDRASRLHSSVAAADQLSDTFLDVKLNFRNNSELYEGLFFVVAINFQCYQRTFLGICGSQILDSQSASLARYQLLILSINAPKLAVYQSMGNNIHCWPACPPPSL